MTRDDLQQIIDAAGKMVRALEPLGPEETATIELSLSNARDIEHIVRIALAAWALRQEIDDDGYPRVYGDTSHGHGVGGQTMCSAFPDVLMRLDSALRDAGLLK